MRINNEAKDLSSKTLSPNRPDLLFKKRKLKQSTFINDHGCLITALLQWREWRVNHGRVHLRAWVSVRTRWCRRNGESGPSILADPRRAHYWRWSACINYFEKVSFCADIRRPLTRGKHANFIYFFFSWPNLSQTTAWIYLKERSYKKLFILFLS